MDFFADGGFQQLFCDLNEQYTSTAWENPLESSYSSYESCYSNLQDISQFHEENSLYFENDHHLLIAETETEMEMQHSVESQSLTDISEKQLQASLDYLLNTSYETLEHQNDALFYNSSLPFIAKDLSDWEDKFLDNYIEIPELVDFLPEKTPLCTETCNHFLQESAENLKLFPSPPSSPASLFSSDCSTPSKSLRENSKENDKTYPCNFGDCGKIYAKPAHLKAHLRRHMGEKPYICTWSDCTWRFSRSDELARHRRSHSGIKPYKCTFCAKCFARSDHLTKHRKVHERRLLAASKAGKMLGGVMPQSVLTVRPGRKRKNQL